MPATQTKLTREKFIAALNEDLSREYQAIIAYVNYSQVGAGKSGNNVGRECFNLWRQWHLAQAIRNHFCPIPAF